MSMELVRNLPYNHPYRWDGTEFGYKKLWRPTELSTALWLDAEDASSITLNGVTVSQWADKSGNGRHATQANAANQPAYAASQNLLQYSEALNNAYWVKRGTCAITANDTTAPDGTLTADRLTGINTTSNDFYNSNYLSYKMGDAGASFTPSFYIKRISTSGTFTIGNTVNDNLYGRWLIDLAQLPDAWVRITANTTGVTVQVPFIFDYRGYGGILFRGVTGGALSMHVWGIQINRTNVLMPYQRTEGIEGIDIKGKPTLNWSGANNIFLDTTSFSLASNRKYSTFAVASSPTWNNYRRLWVSLGGYSGGYIGTGGTVNTALALSGGWTDANNPVVNNVSDVNILSSIFGTAGIATDTMAISVNGNTDVTRVGGTGGIGTTGIRIGADSVTTPGAFAWDGQIGEIIIVSGDLTLSNRQRFEGYLAWKWGLEANLPTNHPYKNTPPTV